MSITPWIVYGTVTLTSGQVVDNPIPNSNGIIGEQTILPYTVPEGYNLIITNMQVEGPACDYSSNSSQFGMGIWLGTAPCTNAKWVISCTTTGGSNTISNSNIILPAGTIFNLRMMNNTSAAWVDGWVVQGYLEPTS